MDNAYYARRRASDPGIFRKDYDFVRSLLPFPGAFAAEPSLPVRSASSTAGMEIEKPSLFFLAQRRGSDETDVTLCEPDDSAPGTWMTSSCHCPSAVPQCQHSCCGTTKIQQNTAIYDVLRTMFCPGVG